ncbi:MAG: hypothetical protein Q9213_008306 [Squamulea squamosa]
MSLFIVCIYYRLGLVPEEFMNTIDKGVVATLRSRSRGRPAKFWEPTLRTAILMYSDQQIVTGLAILACGYAQLRCRLSEYHWQIIVYLAWHSSLTHLATLTFLRQYFRHNPTARLWRAILMLLMVMMLSVALLPTGDRRWSNKYDGDSDNGAFPVLCAFRRLTVQKSSERYRPDSVTTSTMLISIAVLFLSYLTRLIKLSQQATAFTRRWMRTKPGSLIRRVTDDAVRHADKPNASKYWRLKHFAMEGTHIFLRALVDIAESTLWESYPLDKAITNREESRDMKVEARYIILKVIKKIQLFNSTTRSTFSGLVSGHQRQLWRRSVNFLCGRLKVSCLEQQQTYQVKGSALALLAVEYNHTLTRKEGTKTRRICSNMVRRRLRT